MCMCLCMCLCAACRHAGVYADVRACNAVAFVCSFDTLCFLSRSAQLVGPGGSIFNATQYAEADEAAAHVF